LILSRFPNQPHRFGLFFFGFMDRAIFQRHGSWLFSAPAVLFVYLAAATASAQQSYLITDLGTNVTPIYISDSGDVVGLVGQLTVDNSGAQRAFFYTNGVATNLPFGPGTTNSGANAINDLGQAVGWYEDSIGDVHTFISTNINTLTDLGVGLNTYPAANPQWNGAAGINDAGQILGTRSNNLPRAYLIANGVTNNLPTFGGTSDTTYAGAINQNCGVAYTVMTTNYYSHYQFACLYTTNAGQFILPLPANSNSYANAINDSNQVVGYLKSTNNSPPHIMQAFLYDGTVVTNIGDPATNGFATASGINNYGQVVGYLLDTNPVPRTNLAFVYDETNGLSDLNAMLPPGSGWVLGQPTGINNPGQIIGSGSFGGKAHGFLLTPALIFDPSSFKFKSGTVTLTISGINGDTVVIQVSCDLMSWTPISTNVIRNNKATFNDSGTCPPGSIRAYRAIIQ
jgi:probable HAF family extracellular repeat protein